MSSSTSSITSQQPILPKTKKTTQTNAAQNQRDLTAEIEEMKNQITTISTHLSQLQSNLKKLGFQLMTKKMLIQTQKKWIDKRRNKKIKMKNELPELGILK